MKESNASHFNKCFAFDVLLRSSKMTLTNTYTIQHVFNIEYLRSRLGEAVCFFSKSGEKRDPEGVSLELVKGSATDYFDNIKFTTKFSHYYCDKFKFNQ